ncbi:MAG: CCA tRNA nucleotidyltransferase [Candidatus Micrarchaeota archaeon]|nr:CCA tRNA nucleotidyltransferase [Candidatus Micrarchaeota archaeon]MDE1824312.1 CCA tRNA nucleotidyltransferase [Candidatus Micrarchaeota archaeon]
MGASKDKKATAIFKRILKDIKPTKVEIEATTANVNRLTAALKRIVPKNIEIRVAGSVARGTNLKGDADIDFFLLFEKGTSREKLVEHGLSYGKALAKAEKSRFEIKYAEHPYVRVYVEDMGIKADIVPAWKIKSADEMGTMVDRTPLHTEFINGRMSDRQRDDVRLLKFLLKKHNIYGAEVKVGGFPGYLCELLVYHYGSLAKLLEAAASYKLPLILDPSDRANVEDPKITKKFNSDFVVLDPVDVNRNVAAGLSVESLGRFVILAREFVKRPSAGLFYGEKFSHDDVPKYLASLMKDTGLDIYLLVTKVPDESEDTTWPQLRKLSEILEGQIARYGYEVYISMPYISGKNGVIGIVAPKSWKTSRLLKGPDIFIRNASDSFIGKHKGAFGFAIRGRSVLALEKGRYPTIGHMLEDLAKGRIPLKSKHIDFKGARLYANEVPKELMHSTYYELKKRLSLP